MAARTFHYADDTVESSATVSGDQDKVTLTFTPEDVSAYYLVASAMITAKLTTVLGLGKLVDKSGPTDLARYQNCGARATTDYMSMFDLAAITYGVAPGSKSYAIDWGGDGTHTKYIEEARILALKKGANDNDASDDTQSTTTSSAYQDKLSLTFTPGTSGDYLILACTHYGHNSTTSEIQIALDVDGAVYGAAQLRARVATTAAAYAWGTVVKVTLSAASHTVKVKFRSVDNATTANLQYTRIIALRLSDFENAYYAESRGDQNTTSSAAQTAASLTQELQPVSHVAFACALRAVNGTGVQGFTKLTNAGGDMIAENSRASETGSTTSVHPEPFVQMIKFTGSGVSDTFSIKYRNGDNATRTDIYDAAIAILQLDVPDHLPPNNWQQMMPLLAQ